MPSPTPAVSPSPSSSPLLVLPAPQDIASPSWWHKQVADLVDWLLHSGVSIVVIVVVFFVALKISRALMNRTMRIAFRSSGKDALRDLLIAKRQKTLVALFNAIIATTLGALALMMILPKFGFEIGPLLASAGIAGVAIGLGAQSLVKDLLSGTFVILEQQFSVGDVVKIGALAGTVEELNLRTVVLRDEDGSVHIIPNGQIDKVSVLTRDWSRLVLDVDVPEGADIDKASACLKRVFDAYAAEHSDIVLEPPQMLGMQTLTPTSSQLRATMRLLPGRQWTAGNDLRERVKKAFDAEHITR